MSGKELYEVTTEITTYVMASNRKEACDLASDYIDSHGVDPVDSKACIVRKRDIRIDGGWTDDSILPGSNYEMTLGKALSRVVER